MKTFHCSHCQHTVFFENTDCVQCGHVLAYLPDLGEMAALEKAAASGEYARPGAAAGDQRYRLCANYESGRICNWALPADSPETLCPACRLTRVIPDLNQAGNTEKWYRLEVAKRRLIYSLVELTLPVVSKALDPRQGLAFEFLADPAPGAADAAPVLTGHADGVITVNLAEVDDAERERRRLAMREPYRTLLGHFRHEIGHYYWDRLIRQSPWLDEYRSLFGDERESYAEALKRYYDAGPPDDWQQRFVSAYACSHSWEDWAETWAHYLHMSDALETAVTNGLSLRPTRRDEPRFHPDRALLDSSNVSFDLMISNWFSLTYVLNNLNRSMGTADAYPFVLSTPAIEKLRFVHERISSGVTAPQALSAS